MIWPMIAAAAGGAAVFGLLVPSAANSLLKRSFERSRAWWWDSYESYRAFEREGSATGLRKSAGGEEGAVALWLEDAVAAAKAGSLVRERVQALAEAGCDVDPARAVRDEEEQRLRCSYRVGPLGRLACAIVGAVGGWLLSLVSPHPVAFALAALCWFALVVGTVCDIRARILPLEVCAAVALAGGTLQLCFGELEGFGWGCLVAVMVGTVCAVANRLFARGKAVPVGRGDMRCMAALSVASGAAAPLGFAACYVTAAAFSLGGMAVGKLTLSDGIPMAPFLGVWLACGIAATFG